MTESEPIYTPDGVRLYEIDPEAAPSPYGASIVAGVRANIHNALEVSKITPPDYGFSLDKYMVPFQPGRLVTILARPGHGKTSFMAYLAKAHAVALEATGRSETIEDGQRRVWKNLVRETEAVFVLTAESTVEEISGMIAANEDMTTNDIAWGRIPTGDKFNEYLAGQSRRVGPLAIQLIGPKAGVKAKQSQLLTVELMFEEIERVYDTQKIKPAIVFADYLQVMTARAAANSTELSFKTDAAVRLLREKAIEYGVCVVCTAQAGRATDEQKIKLPQAHHAQWASAIEQVSDGMMSLWRPWKTEEDGETVTVGKTSYVVTPNLTLLRLLKQRGAPAGKTWGLEFDVNQMTINELSDTYVGPQAWNDAPTAPTYPPDLNF